MIKLCTPDTYAIYMYIHTVLTIYMYTLCLYILVLDTQNLLENIQNAQYACV